MESKGERVGQRKRERERESERERERERGRERERQTHTESEGVIEREKIHCNADLLFPQQRAWSPAMHVVVVVAGCGGFHTGDIH